MTASGVRRFSRRRRSNFIPTGIGKLGLSVSAGGSFDALTGENLTWFAAIPATYRLNETMRINVNGGWLWDRTVRPALSALRHGFDWKFTDTLQWTIEAFGQAGPTDEPSTVRPRLQTGLRYRPNEIFSVDVIYGHNITGETRTGSRSAPRSAFRCRAASPITSGAAICEPTKAIRTSREVALPEYVKIEKGLGPDGRIAVVRFDRGDGINAMSPEAMRQLTNAARSFEDDASTSVVVLTGGAKSFTAGFDLKDPEGRSRKEMDLGTLRRHLKLGPRMTRAWQDMEQITIGAIEGFCVGGGVALAVALDFRVMARDGHMRVPEIGLGMNMSWQSVPRMLHLMGPARTKQAVILADQRISAAEA